MNIDTPWTRFLTTQAGALEPTQHVVEFGDPRQALQLAGERCLAVPLVHLGVLKVTGDDAATLLHNLLSNDIKKLDEGAVQHSSLNSPKGRMLANFLAWMGNDGFRLAVSADLAAAIQKKLAMYVLRAKAKVLDASDERALIGLCGQSSALMQRAGLPIPAEPMTAVRSSDSRVCVFQLDADRFVVDMPAEDAATQWSALMEAGAMAAGTTVWNWFDIQAGIPLVTAANQEEFVAQMVNFEILGGVDFKKGCYPGQEIVARTQYLGKLKKRMYRAHVATEAAPAVNDDLYSTEFGDQSCGMVLTVAPSPQGGFDLLAVLQIAAKESNDVTIGSPAGERITFLDLPYPVD